MRPYNIRIEYGKTDENRIQITESPAPVIG